MAERMEIDSQGDSSQNRRRLSGGLSRVWTGMPSKEGVSVGGRMQARRVEMEAEKVDEEKTNTPVAANVQGFEVWMRFTAQAGKEKSDEVAPNQRGSEAVGPGGQTMNADTDAEVD
ncbi:hypothetical protein R1sor_016425 [Riccia sorocarpa]|uniref:Uncharacterized protein n=1 Tax=Riccia sorocarpa TaxID=122646 RepID=A0ABD3HJ31_9MARC